MFLWQFRSFKNHVNFSHIVAEEPKNCQGEGELSQRWYMIDMIFHDFTFCALVTWMPADSNYAMQCMQNQWSNCDWPSCMFAREQWIRRRKNPKYFTETLPCQTSTGCSLEWTTGLQLLTLKHSFKGIKFHFWILRYIFSFLMWFLSKIILKSSCQLGAWWSDCEAAASHSWKPRRLW